MADTKQIAIVNDHSLFTKGLAAIINMFPMYQVIIAAPKCANFRKRLDQINFLIV